jgi:hypothetical protein
MQFFDMNKLDTVVLQILLNFNFWDGPIVLMLYNRVFAN